MKRKRRERELTAKQVKTIASIISICVFLVFIAAITANIFNRVSKGSISGNDVYTLIGGYILSLMIAGLIYVVVFGFLDGDLKVMREENRKIKAEIMGMLSKTEFKEVSLQIEDSARPIEEMLMDILEEEGCKFYAKYDDKKDEIIIKCIDESGKEIYEDTISNGFYFKKFFKVS